MGCGGYEALVRRFMVLLSSDVLGRCCPVYRSARADELQGQASHNIIFMILFQNIVVKSCFNYYNRLMNKFIEKYLDKILIGVIILIVAIIGVTGYFVYTLLNSVTSIKSEISFIKNEIASTTQDFNGKIKDLQLGLDTTSKTGAQLSQSLQAQQSQSATLGQTLNGLASTVGTLEKLSKTDRELLQKYSKVYFLNENYVPVQLSNIDPAYLQNKTASLQFHTVVMPFLIKMFEDAGTNPSAVMQVVSAYRSFGTQSALKNSYRITYGSGANTFSADQGYSEHQLGTTVDLTTPSLDSVLDIKFESTPSFIWLTGNAYKYGFILSYPKNNAFYQYEPWHWRFVGVALATKLHNDNKYFYDLDQREIDKYLVNIFDPISQ